MHLGQQKKKEKKYMEAGEYYAKAYDMLKLYKNEFQYGICAAEALGLRGSCFWEAGEYEAALEIFEASLDMLFMLDKGSQRVPLYRFVECYGDITSCQTKLKQFEEAKKSAEQSLVYAAQADPEDILCIKEKGRTYYHRADLYIVLGEIQLALADYEAYITSLVQLKKEGLLTYPEELYYAYTNCADIYIQSKIDMQRAIELLELAIEENEKLSVSEHPPGRNYILYNKIGVCYYALDLREKELEAYTKAINILQEYKYLPVSEEVAAIYGNRGETNSALENYEEAEKDYACSIEVLNCMKKEKRPFSELIYYSNIRNLIKLKLIRKSTPPQTLLKQVKEQIRRLKRKKEEDQEFLILLAKFHIVCAEIYRELARLHHAVSQYTRAIVLYLKIPDSEYALAAVYNYRAEVYENSEKYMKAAGDYTEVAEILEGVNKRHPNDATDKIIIQKLVNSAVLFDNALDFEGARQRFSQIIERVQGHYDWEEDYDFIDTAALAYFRRGADFTRIQERNYSKAVRDYQKSSELLLKILKSPGVPGKLSAVFSAQAEIYEAFGEYEMAKSFFEKSSEYGERGSDVDSGL